MPLVVALFWLWLSLHVLAALPRKLPLQVNLVLYLALSVIVINKFTILSFKLKLFTYSTSVPDFLAAVVNRDFTMTLTLIAFANACVTATTPKWRWLAAAFFLLFLVASCQSLRRTGVVKDHHWNAYYDALLNVGMMAIAYGLARLFQHLWNREALRHVE